MCLVSFSKVKEYSSKTKLDVFSGRPLWAYINITSQCTHKCRWCYGGFNGNLSDEMPYADFLVILEKLKEIGISQVTLSGGEPTEHPMFREFVQATADHGFLAHVVTHGGTLAKHAAFLAAHGMKQVQVNYQGAELHDREHGVPGSYNAQQAGIREALRAGMEVTATITVGQFNMARIPKMFSELDAAGLDRFRIWESTGRGLPWRKSLEAGDIFRFCREEAARLGFTFVQSYDPEFEGDTGTRCPPMSNLFLHINTTGKLRFCPAVLHEPDVADFVSDTPGTLLEKFYANNARLLQKNGGEPWCVARGEKSAAHA